MKRQDLTNELKAILTRVKQEVQTWENLSLEQLNKQPSAESWSALACLNHLNQYAQFYLPELKQRIEQNTSQANAEFFPGMLGDYFAKSMLVVNNQVKKMKSPKDMRPTHSVYTLEDLHQFLADLETISVLLDDAQKVNLTKTKVSISLTPWIKLRLGDTFRFYIYHIDRHVWQGKRALK